MSGVLRTVWGCGGVCVGGVEGGVWGVLRAVCRDVEDGVGVLRVVCRGC